MPEMPDFDEIMEIKQYGIVFAYCLLPNRLIVSVLMR